MMYSEFLEKAQMTESTVSFKYYTEKIEPVYMDCINFPTQKEFCEKFEELYNQMVMPVMTAYLEKVNKDMMDKWKNLENVTIEYYAPKIERLHNKLMDNMVEHLEIIMNWI